jgi:hypothetical protein
LLKRFSRNPDVEKASAEFENAQGVGEKFHHDFDGVDFTDNSLPPYNKSAKTSDGRLSCFVKGVPLYGL